MKPFATYFLINLSRVSRRTLLLVVCFLSFQSVLHSGNADADADSESSSYVATTTADYKIPPLQLQWLVNPLTKDELIVEADAWRDLLRQKAAEISAAEISVLRRNKQIQKSEEAAAATEEAIEAANEAKQLEKEAETLGDAEAQEEAAEVAEEALEKAADAQKAIEEVKEANESDAIDAAAAQAVEQVQEETDVPEVEPAAGIAGAGVELLDVETNKIASANELSSVVDAVSARAELSEAEKAEMLDALTELRTQRAHLIERFDIVLEELLVKGGDVELHQKYRDAVGENIVNVEDTSAIWTFVVGWIASETGGVKWAVNILKFVVIMVVFYFLSQLVGKAVEKATRKARTMSHLLRDFINMIVRRGIIIIGLMVAVNAIGIAITPLLALITAAGLVIGLALQGTLSNFASGLLLLLYRPFDVGDAIDAGGTAGTVDSMNLMSTIVRTWDNKVMIVPNNNIWGNTITNISRTNRRRVDLVFGIGYSDPIDKTQGILEKILKDHPDILKDPEPVVRVHELGDSSVNFVVRPWVKPENYWEVYWSITRKVKEEFDAQGISIPFPQRDVHFYQETNGEVAAVSDLQHPNKGRSVPKNIPADTRLEIDDDDS